MNEIEMNWDDLRLFLAVARGGGLAAAATQTGKSAPTLGRRMLALERQLGRDLFRRMPRGYEMTAEGETLLATVAALEHQIAPLSADDHTVPIVKISAGTWVTHVLCNHVATIGAPNIGLRFIAADQRVDIGHREAVVGVRNQRPTEIGLAGRRVGRVDFATYATRDDVTTWAHVMGPTPSARWVQQQPEHAPRIEVTHPRNALDLAHSGAAKVVLPRFIGQKCQGLMQVSEVIDELTHDQWLVSHHEDRFLPEVRVVIDRIYETLRRELSAVPARR